MSYLELIKATLFFSLVSIVFVFGSYMIFGSLPSVIESMIFGGIIGLITPSDWFDD